MAKKVYTVRLRPKCGNHVEGKGKDKKTYTGGDTFESDRPLHKIFANKFDLVSEGKATKKKEEPAPPAPPVEEPKEEEPPVDETEDIIEEESEEELTDEVSEEDKAEAESFGENVTEDFKSAKEADLTVYKSGRKWLVYDPDTNSVVADKLNKGQVDDAIKAYINGE